jgi:hypothetical protein
VARARSSSCGGYRLTRSCRSRRKSSEENVDHDVSILIAVGGGGRYRGVEPRSKVSMMFMRPPQHGHGCVGLSAAAVLSGACCLCAVCAGVAAINGQSVARRIVDRRVLHLIKMWLDCPVEETDDRGRKTRTTVLPLPCGLPYAIQPM